MVALRIDWSESLSLLCEFPIRCSEVVTEGLRAIQEGEKTGNCNFKSVCDNVRLRQPRAFPVTVGAPSGEDTLQKLLQSRGGGRRRGRVTQESLRD